MSELTERYNRAVEANNNARAAIAGMQGRLDGLMDRLRTDFNVNSIEEAVELQKKMQTEMETYRQALSSRLDSVEATLKGAGVL